jgi:tetratricopeptide (TPR) repeat protein
MTAASPTPGEPAELDALVALAKREHHAGRLAESAAAYRKVLAIRPNIAEAHFKLGNVLRDQDKFDEAAARYEQVIALRPDHAGAHYNLGNALKQLDRLDQARARYEQAIALRPDYANAYNNLGNLLLIQGKLDEAAARYEQALALRPDYAGPRLGLAACYLIEEDYERGWPAYESRLRVPGLVHRCSVPRWAGESLAGRSLLLLAEQGLGDTLQFVRYARAVKERGARVVLVAQPALGRLLANHPDVDEMFLLGSAEELPRCDFYLPLLSAPCAFGTGALTIPNDVPYLRSDPELADHWRRELAAIDGFKIGIAWQGSRNFPLDRWRSMPLAHFSPLASLPGVRLVSLQKGFGSEQLKTVDFPVIDLSGRLDEEAGPLMDTAAVIRGVDLVVTSDTVIAHLAGALGVPVWVALNFSPNWRWLLGRDDSPWYPTMRLFRQTEFDGWPDVFSRIAKAVQAHRSEEASSTGVDRD